MKGKVHPIILHGSTDTERWYSSTLSLTSVLDGGGQLMLPCPGPFTLGYDPLPIVWETDILQKKCLKI